MKRINETTFGINTTKPQHVVGITNAIIEESKSMREGGLDIEHHHMGLATTRYSFADATRSSQGTPDVSVSLSHIIYPEETLAVVFEDRTRPNTVPAGSSRITTYPTVTRHYQPKNYLGKNVLGGSNSGIYQTPVSRLDETNIHTDIFHFLKTGNLPR